MTELQDFVTLVLKLTGNWKQSKVGGRPKADQPPALKHTFQDKKTNVTLNWWSSSKTLNLQGGQDQIASIEKTIASFLVNTVPDSSVQFSSDMTDTNESEQNSSSQDKGNQVNPSESEIKNIWKVTENLKAQLTVLNSNLMKNVRTAQNTDTQENVLKITCEKTEKHLKEKINLNESDSNLTATKPSTSDKVPKQKSVTEFFKPIKDEEYSHMNETNTLIVRIRQLEQEKKASVQQVDEMKQDLNSLKSRNTNPTPKNKKKKPKRKTSQSQSTSAPSQVKVHQKQQSEQQQQQQQKPTTKKQQPKQQPNEQQATQPRNQQKSTEENTSQGQDQIKDKPSTKSKPKTKQIIIAGDSIIKGLRGWMMSRDNRVKVHSFSGANTDEMQHFLKPLLNRRPSHVILHCGTNDRAQGSSCREVSQRIIDLGKNIVNKGMTCSISMLTKRMDGLNPLVQQVNSLIEKGLKSESNIDFINNDTISEYHLNSSGLHLNRKGDAVLARNIIQYIKSRSSL